MKSLWAAALLAACGARAAALEIRADARVELVAGVYRLAGDALRRGTALPAALEIDRKLAPFADHPAVRRAKVLRSSGLSASTALQFAFHLSTAPPLRLEVPPAEIFEDAAGGASALESFAEELSSLEAASGFFAWFAGETGPGPGLQRELSRAAGDGLEKGLEEYLGVRTWARWTLVASPSVDAGGIAAWIIEEMPGGAQAYVILGPGPKGTFEKGRSLAEAAWPEAAYTASYLLIERCRPALARLGPETCDGAGGLRTPEGCIQSLWTSAIVERAAARAFGGGVKAPSSPVRAALDASLADWEKRRGPSATLFDEELSLWAPFGAAEADCPLPGPGLDEPHHRRRLLRLLDLRLSRSDSPRLRKARAQARAAEGDLEGALADAREAAAAVPGDPEAQLHLGVLLTRKGEPAAALEAFDACGRAAGEKGLEPGLDADLWSSRASAELALGRAGAASSSLKRALTRAPAGWPRLAQTRALLRSVEGGRTR